MIYLIFLSLCFLSATPAKFIRSHDELSVYSNTPNVVMVASTGCSGSSMLTRSLVNVTNPSLVVLKTHLLPPTKDFNGKILFIYSNPDQSAESHLHKTINDSDFGRAHFNHIETSDRLWLNRIGSTKLQTLEDNLLSYDALGCFKHLEVWLHTGVEACPISEANILAVKYENLWEEETQQAIKTFLNNDSFELPLYRPRGYRPGELLPQEIAFRQAYNLGSEKNPLYVAYDKARPLWEQAPPFQFLKIR